MGLTVDDALAIMRARVEKWEREETERTGGRDPLLPVALDPHALLARQRDVAWLVEDIWPLGRQVHMHAPRKSGKSLVTLWMSLCLATGRDPFSGNAITPVRIGYLDYEMTEDDLAERVEEMGFAADQLVENWKYYLLPMLPALDTMEGGQRLAQLAATDKLQAVVIDTLSRVVVGEENSNDTYIRFYKHTGQLLKGAGVALLRLDHEGHESGRSRGASSKADDVDLVWQFRKMDGDAYEFVRKAARISWVPEKVVIHKREDPTLAFARAHGAWTAGTLEKAQELDAVGAPLDVPRRTAAEMLRDKGYTAGTNQVLSSAIRYRKTRVLGI